MSDDILDMEASYDSRISNDSLKKLAEKEEPRFLSILLRNKECLMDAMSFGIKPGAKGHFWFPKTRSLFSIIFAYYQKYHTILTRTAIDSVMESMEEINGKSISEEDRTNARMYWDATWNVNSPVEDYELLRDNLNNRYVQWQAYEIMRNKLDTIVKSTSNQVKLIKDVREDFYKIDNLDADPYALTMDIKEGLDKVTDYITNRRDHPEENPAVLTGINAIDKIYHGFNPGSYTVISGQINGGKTTFLFNVGFNMAKAQHGVVYVSMEKEAVPFYTRLLALHALTDYNRIKVGGKGEHGLSDYYYNRLIDAAKDLKENICPKLVCIQLAQTTKLSKLIAEVEKVKARMKVDVLIVDYLGVVGHESNHPGRADLDEAMTSQRLQTYGRVNRFVTITASQLKTPSAKEARSKSKKATNEDPSKIEVNSEDIAGSKMIPADADNSLAVLLNSDSPPTKMFVFGTKARDDEARRTVVLDFDGKLGKISDPVLEPGQITEIDQIVYNTGVTEESLANDDGLFDGMDEPSSNTTTTTTTSPIVPTTTSTTTKSKDPESKPKPSKNTKVETKENTSVVDEVFETGSVVTPKTSLPIPNDDSEDIFN